MDYKLIFERHPKYLLVTVTGKNSADFAGTVAINRGMPVKVFRSVVDAERWLIDQVQGSDEQFIFRDHHTSR